MRGLAEFFTPSDPVSVCSDLLLFFPIEGVRSVAIVTMLFLSMDTLERGFAAQESSSYNDNDAFSLVVVFASIPSSALLDGSYAFAAKTVRTQDFAGGKGSRKRQS